ncbi:tyrosine-type recombinase/integrase [Saccharopolyspora sp. 7B]|nr:tyrosine-type recombinase/integrase [Saccharopolyspora sp. 7B]
MHAPPAGRAASAVHDLRARPGRPATRARWRRELLAGEKAAFIATHLALLRDTIHPHSARHSYATHAKNRGAEARQIPCDLGHATLTTTEGYLHDAAALADSAAHDLAPALHRGWLPTAAPHGDEQDQDT